MLSVHTSQAAHREKEYIFGVIFDEFLGIPWIRVVNENHDQVVIIRMEGASGEVQMPEVFFHQCDKEWLCENRVPQLPLPMWNRAQSGFGVDHMQPHLPVIFGDAEPTLTQTADAIRLPIDIFGAAFFMLSRYEEAVNPARDYYDRFPAAESLAVKAEFLNFPIVDEYVELLWTAMNRVWPGLKRKTHQSRTFVSCDVDSPFRFSLSPKVIARRFSGDLLKRHSPAMALKNVAGSLKSLVGREGHDSHRARIDWMMEMNEQRGTAVAFNFIPEITNPRLDGNNRIVDPRVRRLIKTIHERGHEIGIHPGCLTYNSGPWFEQSASSFFRVMEEESIDQPRFGGRQHLLRWKTSTTATIWQANGLDYDSTLGFAERPGFRCGTCREYPLYDLQNRCKLTLRERPLIVMECSVIAQRYMGLGYSDEALDLMTGLRDTCHRWGGDFTLLWHNSHLETEDDRRFYLELIG